LIPVQLQTVQQFAQKLDDACKEVHGVFSVLNKTSGNCSCVSGYELINNTCKQKEVSASVLLPNSESSKTIATSSLSKKNMSLDLLGSTSTATASTSVDTTPKKISWFMRFINWFR